MPDFAKTYGTLVIQPIDLVRAFKVDFCLASVIKWLTKWHMEKKYEYLQRARYYIDLCDSEYNRGLMFAIRLYCIANGFMKDNSNSSTCLLESVVFFIMHGEKDRARARLNEAELG